jgi:hypothetical protein
MLKHTEQKNIRQNNENRIGREEVTEENKKWLQFLSGLHFITKLGKLPHP